VESNQVHIIAAAVSCDAQQIIRTVKSRFTGQLSRDVGDADQLNRIHDDVALFHAIPTANPHVWARPDANAAPDSPLADSITKMFAEHHTELHPKSQSARSQAQKWGRRGRLSEVKTLAKCLGFSRAFYFGRR